MQDKKELLHEFKSLFDRDFTEWLIKSNNKKIRDFKQPKTFINKISHIEVESLQDILNILLREPEADYFWYNSGGELTYALPKDEAVAKESIRVDKDKTKIFLRDYKLCQIIFF